MHALSFMNVAINRRLSDFLCSSSISQNNEAIIAGVIMSVLFVATVVEVQLLSMLGAGGAEDAQAQGGAALLSRGLELSSPPTIHQVLDGHPLIR